MKTLAAWLRRRRTVRFVGAGLGAFIGAAGCAASTLALVSLVPLWATSPAVALVEPLLVTVAGGVAGYAGAELAIRRSALGAVVFALCFAGLVCVVSVPFATDSSDGLVWLLMLPLFFVRVATMSAFAPFLAVATLAWAALLPVVTTQRGNAEDLARVLAMPRDIRRENRLTVAILAAVLVWLALSVAIAG